MKRERRTDQPIDCIKMKRKIQEQIYRETRGMTLEEELRYFQEKVAKGPFADLLKRPARRRVPASS
jgi:hypothetical protein